MKPRDQDFLPMNNRSLSADDPELEREFQMWAQWLLDVYLWKLEQERTDNSTEVDTL